MLENLVIQFWPFEMTTLQKRSIISNTMYYVGKFDPLADPQNFGLVSILYDFLKTRRT